MSAAWILEAGAEDACAGAWLAVLDAAGLRASHKPAAGAARLISPQGRRYNAAAPADILAALRAIGGEPAAAGPRQIDLAQRALQRIGLLRPFRASSDLDLEVFALRHILRQLEEDPALPAATGPEAALAAPECFLAPLLWRIGLLDRAPGLFLLSGFPRLEALQAGLAGHPRFSGSLSPAAGRRFLQSLQEKRQPDLPETDWSRALGPEGQERGRPQA